MPWEYSDTPAGHRVCPTNAHRDAPGALCIHETDRDPGLPRAGSTTAHRDLVGQADLQHIPLTPLQVLLCDKLTEAVVYHHHCSLTHVTTDLLSFCCDPTELGMVDPCERLSSGLASFQPRKTLSLKNR